MKKLICLFLLALTIGCATTEQRMMEYLTRYSNENLAKAEAGQIQWSDYYQGMLEKVQRLPDTVPSKSFMVTTYSEGIVMAKQYESGKMSKADFYTWRQNANQQGKDKGSQMARFQAECQYEAVSRANPNSSVEYNGANVNRQFSSAIVGGIEVGMRQNEIFNLCINSKMKALDNEASVSKSTASSNTASMEQAKGKCIELGFKAGTESFGQCVLKMAK
ncbi:hypothetical protein G6698_01005 [Polynucleobacter paneuropaeus]|jgi:hypothetical protein|uniref:hypothetical protein n=1 Tax=Polynucleobacter sp. MWH-P3-07-1 TaxID=1743173 RepID=UPI001BFE51B8|nr:hypothetical protein [Polynucleobacter sp. MWH-P3-07-1]MBT8566575.1 hypothetical protein [Polynucleobacter paneuropaeus]MBT8575884.1 hypothetical protein [Polynucleobacter paneuropaeus]QWD84051.1 hypothetical protein ICU98_03010 [Polynucleobacter sp. MWH-P3-07-1]